MGLAHDIEPRWESVKRTPGKPWIVVGAGATIETALLPGRLLDLQVDYELSVTSALSPAALDFVTLTALSAITGSPVYHDNRQLDAATGAPLHAVLCEADALVLYPASARIIANCALGIVDCCVTRMFAFMDKSRVLIAPSLHPAMDKRIYEPHLTGLRALGCTVLAADGWFAAWAEVVNHLETRLSLQRQTESPMTVLLNRMRERRGMRSD